MLLLIKSSLGLWPRKSEVWFRIFSLQPNTELFHHLLRRSAKVMVP